MGKSNAEAKLLAQGLDVNKNDLKKFLSFYLKKQLYGVDLLSVREIIRIVNISPIPNSGDSIKGVINLRGKIIPVFDVKKRMSINDSIEFSETSCIIILDHHCTAIGIIVDRVMQVLSLDCSQLEPRPSVLSENGNASSSIKQIGKFEQEVILILDLEVLLSNQKILDPKHVLDDLALITNS